MLYDITCLVNLVRGHVSRWPRVCLDWVHAVKWRRGEWIEFDKLLVASSSDHKLSPSLPLSLYPLSSRYQIISPNKQSIVWTMLFLFHLNIGCLIILDAHALERQAKLWDQSKWGKKKQVCLVDRQRNDHELGQRWPWKKRRKLRALLEGEMRE